MVQVVALAALARLNYWCLQNRLSRQRFRTEHTNRDSRARTSESAHVPRSSTRVSYAACTSLNFSSAALISSSLAPRP